MQEAPLTATDQRRRIAIVAEELSAHADEGALNFLLHLLRHLDARHELLALHSRGEPPPELPTRRVSIPRLWAGRELRAQLRSFDPEVLLYVPSAAATINALWRGRLLARAVPGARFSLLSHQHRDYGAVGRRLVRWLAPEHLIVMSERSLQTYRRLGLPAVAAPVGVDLDRFRPLEREERLRLRQRLGWEEGERVVLHVGHLRAARGLHRLEEAAALPGHRVVLVASTATRAEEAVRRRLESGGVELRREFLPRVEEFYQAADVYLFPVEERTESIEFPLSVLEALACDLPTVSTRFGALPERFREGCGLVFLEPEETLAAALGRLGRSPGGGRSQVAELDWTRVFQALEGILLSGEKTE